MNIVKYKKIIFIGSIIFLAIISIVIYYICLGENVPKYPKWRLPEWQKKYNTQVTEIILSKEIRRIKKTVKRYNT